MRWSRSVLLALVLTVVPLGAGAADFSVTGVGGVFGRYPGSMSDPGFALAGARSLWLGRAYRFLQLRADVDGLLGVGRSRTYYVGAGLTVGADLYLFNWLSLDVRMGPGAGLQLGSAGATPMVGMWGGGGWSIHPWADRQRRITLATKMLAFGVFRSDPGNDAPLGSGLLGIGLGYESAF